MQLQGKVPTVREIRVGKGALMRVRKSPRKRMREVKYKESYLLSSDVYAIGWGGAKIPRGEKYWRES